MALERIGNPFLDRPNLREQLEIVRLAESLSYTSVWVTETRLVRDAVSALGALAVSTSRIQQGASVVNTWTRGPVLMALTFATLHELAPDCIVLGLGAYSGPLAADQGIRRQRPLLQMREYVEVLRLLFAADRPVTYNGELIHVNQMELSLGRSQPRSRMEVGIYIGATGPRMMRLAGEIADGVILNGCTSAQHTHEALDEIRAGARDAGREPGCVECPQLIRAAMSRDKDEARAAARYLVTMYLGGQPHIAHAAALDPELAKRLHELVGGWPPSSEGVAASERLVSQTIVDQLVVWGPPERCRERLME